MRDPGAFAESHGSYRPGASPTALRIQPSIRAGFVIPLLLVVFYAPTVPAQSAGWFYPAGIMTTIRDGHTATLLLSGRVLIAGGAGASAELYDPDSGTFSATADMLQTRQREHTVTLLSNGKVLIAGGIDPDAGESGTAWASAELYDPATGTFTATGAMTMARYHHTATLLANSQVLVANGYTQSGGRFYSSEIYDPNSGTFSLTGLTPQEYLYSATATLLTNGAVLITLEGGGENRDDTELYDPVTGVFTVGPDLNRYRSSYDTATLLPDGTVLVAGLDPDYPGVSVLDSAELYDPVTGRFSHTGGMNVGRIQHTASLLLDGTVLVVGGVNPSSYHVNVPPTYTPIASAERYTPAVLKPPPVLFSLSGDGRGQAAIWHNDTGQIAQPATPAVAGEFLALYTVGLVDGGVVPPQVAIGDRLAEVVYFGPSGYPMVNQVNIRVPAGLTPGSEVPVHLTYFGRPSNVVTIAVR